VAGVSFAAAGGGSLFLSSLLTLAVLISAAKVLGALSVRLRQPAVLGELAAGLLLGPSLLDILSRAGFGGEPVGEVIHWAAELGVVWLMFAAGLETNFEDLRQAGRPAAIGGILGVIAPLLMGWGLGLAFGLGGEQAVAIGLILSATSVSISAQTLMELKKLRSREGVALLGAAVIDDVLVVALLSVFVGAVSEGGSLSSVALGLMRMVAVLAVVGAAAYFVLPRLAGWAERLRASQGLLAIVLAAVMMLAWSVESLGGVAAITGAFLAGVGLGRSHFRHEIERGLSPLAYAFFVPLFLVDIGLRSNARALPEGAAWFTIALLVIAAASKLVGSGLGAYLGGFGRGAAVRMGLGMMSRGEIGLIVAGVVVVEGILLPDIFTVVVLMVLVTTMLTPLLLRWAFARQEVNDATAR
jgi:Kef-type K+ transport system membrane component KefB